MKKITAFALLGAGFLYGQGLQSVVCNATVLQTPGSMTCSVSLTAPAPADIRVSVSPSTVLMTMPTSVTVLAGATSASLPVSVAGVAHNFYASVVASYAGKATLHRVQLQMPVAPVEPTPTAPPVCPAPLPSVEVQQPQMREAFRYVALTDTHTFARDRSATMMPNFARMLQHAKAIGADFVVILGDLPGTNPISQPLTEMKEVIDAAPIKVYTVRGNHDEKPVYEALYGSSVYYVDHKGHRFIGADDQETFSPAYNQKPMREDIAKAPSDMPITIWRHRVPTTAPLDEVADLGKYPNVRLALGGHHHVPINWGKTQNLQRITLDDWHADRSYAVVDVATDGTSRITYEKLP